MIFTDVPLVLCPKKGSLIHKFFLVMKLTVIFLTIVFLQASAKGYGQKLSLNEKKAPLEKVLSQIKKQSGYVFLYTDQTLANAAITVKIKDASIEDALNACFKNANISYKIAGKNILLKISAPSVNEELTNAIKLLVNIKGTVLDEKGAPLIGVTIKLKGTKIGTTTDVQGKYQLTIPDGSGVLVFSYVGFQTQELPVNSATTIDVTLKEQPAALGEIVVTALGIRRSEKSLSYATQKVSSEQLNQVKTDNLMNALSGKVAGLTITPSASGVGGSAKVVLRGNRSINGNNQPLYVIDGIPILNTGNANNQPTGTYGGSTDSGDGISNLNPEDIDNISVLEGASAAALYGSLAQNGVILVTTKKGKAGKATINFTSNFTTATAAYKPKFQNLYGKTEGATSGDITSWGPAISNGHDNLSEYFQTGTNFTNAINLSAGSEDVQTYASYANTHSTGIEPGNKLNRNNFNLRETASFLNKKLTVDGSVNYINQRIENSPQLGIYSNPLLSLYLFPRGEDILPYKTNYENADLTGANRQNWISKGQGDLHQDGPWWTRYKKPNTATRNRMLLSGSVKYEFNDWLNIQVRGNVDRASDDFEQDTYSGSNSLYNTQQTGNLKLNTQTITQKYGDLLVNFKIPLSGSNFKINGLLGTSITDIATKGYGFSGDLSTTDFFTAGNIITALPGTRTTNTVLNGIGVGTPQSFTLLPNHSQLQAIFGSADFSYKNWAYLTVTGRNDWSSNLAFTNNVSYFYPSAGLSVVLSDAVKLPQAISYAKLRASFAQVGNTVPPYLTNIQNTEDASGALVFNTAAPFHTLKPEKSNSIELGTDLRFLNNRLNFSFTYYKTNTKNQYVPVIPPSPSLISTGYVNAGEVQNSGISFTLGYDVLTGAGLNWNTSFNGSINKNKIIDVDSKDGINQFFLTNDDNGYQSAITKGGSFGDIYAPVLVKDAQGRVVLSGTGTAADPYKPQKKGGAFELVGNPTPKFQLAWSNSFRYHNFGLNFLVDGKFGGKVMSITQGMMDAWGVSEESGAARAAGGVTINGVNGAGQPVTTVPAQEWYQGRGQRGGITGDYMYSATVVRLREVSLGYTWDIKNSAFKNVKLSLIGRNLIYFYKKAPFDPELTMSTGNGLSGVDVFNQPATRNLGVNLNVTF
jgi:TonB-linked SusC/RagA family outer membrane protein